MKSLFKYFPVIALAFAAASCNDLIDDKEVIDSKYEVALPTVQMSSLKALTYSSAEVSYSCSSIEGLASGGLQIATKEDFSDAKFYEFDSFETSGTATVSGLSDDTKYYGRLFFSSFNGTVFSETMQFSTPSVYSLFKKASYIDNAFVGEQWDVEVEYAEPLNLYRIKSLYEEGLHLYFQIDGETKAVSICDATGAPASQWVTGIIHPSYGSVFVTSEGSSYVVTDEEEYIKFNFEWKVSAGTFGVKPCYLVFE